MPYYQKKRGKIGLDDHLGSNSGSLALQARSLQWHHIEKTSKNRNFNSEVWIKNPSRQISKLFFYLVCNVYYQFHSLHLCNQSWLHFRLFMEIFTWNGVSTWFCIIKFKRSKHSIYAIYYIYSLNVGILHSNLC